MTRLCKVLGRKVRVAHRHGQAMVPQRALQGEDAPAIHHEVACKGVTQHMGELPLRQRQSRSPHAVTKSQHCRPEDPFVFPVPAVMVTPLPLKLSVDRNSTRLARFCSDKLDQATIDLRMPQSLRFAPARAGRKAYLCHQRDVFVTAGHQRRKEKVDLFKCQVRQFVILNLEGTNPIGKLLGIGIVLERAWVP